MTTYIELTTLTDGKPFGAKEIPGTAADYYVPIDEADRRDWYWSALTTPNNLESKQAFWDQYALNRNKLVVVDDLLSVAPRNVLIARNLNLCCMWQALGGGAVGLWLDGGKLRTYPTGKNEFLAACVAEAIDDLKRN